MLIVQKSIKDWSKKVNNIPRKRCMELHGKLTSNWPRSYILHSRSQDTSCGPLRNIASLAPNVHNHVEFLYVFSLSKSRDVIKSILLHVQLIHFCVFMSFAGTAASPATTSDGRWQQGWVFILLSEFQPGAEWTLLHPYTTYIPGKLTVVVGLL